MEADGLLYLSRFDVLATGVTAADLIDPLESMFREKGEGAIEMPPKPSIHPRANSFIHAMPAFVPSLPAAGLKWISGYPENRDRGLPYISGLLILNDPQTGMPLAVMDATWVTALRTGAATAVAARYLARPDSRSVGIIACGVQGRSNLEALARVLPLETVKAYDIKRDAAQRFTREMSAKLKLKITVVATAREAVAGADVVVTSGPILERPQPTIGPGWLEPGAFGCALDFDSYWKGGALREVEKLTTDDTAQLEYYRKLGYFQDTPPPLADLGQIVSGRAPGRVGADERIISLNLGLACEDVVAGMLVFERAQRQGIGTRLPL